MTDKQWPRTILATILVGMIGGCTYFVFWMVALIFGQQGGFIAVVAGAVLAGRWIAVHTNWNVGEQRSVGEEGKPLFIRAPSSVIEAIMREPRCEHLVMLSNRPTVEIPLVTLAVTRIGA